MSDEPLTSARSHLRRALVSKNSRVGRAKSGSRLPVDGAAPVELTEQLRGAFLSEHGGAVAAGKTAVRRAEAAQASLDALLRDIGRALPLPFFVKNADLTSQY